MKLKKNKVGLGSAKVSSTRASSSEARFFMVGDGVIICKTYNLSTRSLKTEASPAAYAAAYLALESGSVQDLGEVTYVADK